MKNFMKIFFALLIAAMNFTNVNAQGDSCANAIAMPLHNSCLTNETMTGSEKWYSFIPDESQVTITVNNPQNTSLGHAHVIELYDACSSPTPVASDVAEVYGDPTSFEDPQLIISANVTSGNTYYIRIRKQPSGGPYSCSICSGATTQTFDLCVQNLVAAPVDFEQAGIWSGCGVNYAVASCVTNARTQTVSLGNTTPGACLPFQVPLNITGIPANARLIEARVYFTAISSSAFPIVTHTFQLQGTPVTVLNPTPTNTSPVGQATCWPYPFQYTITYSTNVTAEVLLNQTLNSTLNGVYEFGGGLPIDVTPPIPPPMFDVNGVTLFVIYDEPCNGNAVPAKLQIWDGLVITGANAGVIINTPGAAQFYNTNINTNAFMIFGDVQVGLNYTEYRIDAGAGPTPWTTVSTGPPDIMHNFVRQNGLAVPLNLGANGFQSRSNPPSQDCYNITVVGIYAQDGNPPVGACPSALAVNITPQINCAAQNTMLTANASGGTPSYSYLWAPGGQNTQAITVNPAITTVYTVTLTDVNNCSVSATVSVDPILPAPAITGFHNVCGDANTGISTYSVPAIYNTYQWSFSNAAVTFTGQGTDVITVTGWNGFVDGTLCVTVTDANCTTDVCIPIYPCCTSCGGVTIGLVEINNLSASQVLNSGTYPQFIPVMDYFNFTLDPQLNPPAPHIIINGNFIIDVPFFKLKDCHTICLGPNARITINSGSTLEIEYATSAFYNWLTSCDIMWDGIYLEDDNAHLVITGIGTSAANNYNAVLQNAKNAVVSNNGGDFQIEFGEFLDCNRDIVMNAYSQPQHPGSVTGSWFHSFGTLANPLRQWYPDYPPSVVLQNGLPRTRTAIEVNDVQWTTIGNGTNGPVWQNKFEYVENGINALNSSVFSFNNRFQHIRQISTSTIPFFPFGYCIYSFQGPSHAGYATTIGGLGTADDPNFFEDCDAGVSIQGGVTQLNYISYNKFDNIGRCIYSGHSNSIFSDIYIDHNSFDNFTRGVHVQDNPLADIRIDNNAFNTIYTTTQLSTAIITQEGPANNGPDLNIHDNMIDRVTTGIFCINERSFMFNAKVDINHIHLDQMHPYLINSTGIKMQSCSKARVSTNDVYRCSNLVYMAPYNAGCFPAMSGNYDYLNSTTNPTGSRLTGISCETSTSTDVFNNYTGYLGTGIRCFNISMPNFFNCNKLGHNQIGFWLDNCLAGPGQQGTSSQPQDNMWNIVLPAFAPPFRRDVYGPPPSFAGETWFVRQSAFGYPWNPNPGFFQPSTSIVTTNTTPPGLTNPNCSYAVPPPGTPHGMQKELADNLRKVNEPACPLSEQAKFYSKLDIYIVLMYDNSLMSLGTDDDAYLQDFYDTESGTAIGDLARVKFNIGDKDYETAESINSTITPENLAAANDKTVNAIYLDTWAKAIYTFTQEQYETLSDIAQQNPISGGPAVYSARAMLDVDYDDYGEQEYRMAGASSEVTDYIHIYPNPATDVLNIDYEIRGGERGEIIITDVAGRELTRQILESNSKEVIISTEQLSNGIYQLRLRINDEIIGNQKLAIVR